MGGVDLADQLLQPNLIMLKTTAWYKTYKMKQTFLQFQLQIISGILYQDAPAPRAVMRESRVGATHFIFKITPTAAKQNPQKKIRVFTKRGQRKDIIFYYPDCPGQPGLCIGDFFKRYHTLAGWTPLHIAASAGRDDIVKALIEKGAQVNASNQIGCTPLHYAASKNKQEITLMLLENGASPDATDKFHSTPLHRAASKGNFKIIQILLLHKASTNIQDSEGNTALHLACDEERIEEAKFLVENGASIYIENTEEKTPLQIARGGFGAVLRRLVETKLQN
ncbi:26S proteasome non-ATPase regulatory subunit 10 isoform X1 [Bombina bombina]|uniref:26S proteasome non-ATPase regulatory subunit 10 isoform X1 n=1 Tax=Bombina bombina TaxID=8345 RepID=UPI00235AD109|nr:26S proteasome non-ATPase regulatory subunit 10 isoform X1 [Bombina bombina]